MNDIPGMINNLEDLLVREFRICQSLHSLTKEERLALSSVNVATLSTIVEQKEALLDDLGQIEDNRRMIAQNLATIYGIQSSTPTIAEIARAINSEIGARMNHIREGILALADEIRVITSGNRMLAMTALERSDAVQSFMLDMYKPALVYQHPGMPKKNDCVATWDVDQVI